ncbi:putative arylamine n-acetyl transferase [Streptomyces spiroverticillatus]|uniref:Arylamine n-acetyl transferase n=1 Tax=Streptomyces finlayi TaxID=67296 RepID=A0A918WSP1_9ACTN|nr:arylamine N-acetyltransferase [Streptomyces finlayi]GGZ86146.1 putative arylamine n-acetyl transferase [Streptomyces spiroverticillatus]GHC77644.1 putative arylamine n-acetyl transferase [Streptomyces finlayi]
MWNSEALDLDAYLKKIGYEGEPAPSLDTLRALHRGHVLGLRWSTIDAMLHHDVPLDLESLQAKLVTGGRAGYCFEHVPLFAAVLEALGFEFFAVQGRVVMGGEKILPTTHALLVVELDGRRWLCDVGFGAAMLEPIELVPGEEGSEVEQDGWRYRLRERAEITPGAAGWELQQPAFGPETDRDGDGWMVRHNFTLTPQYPVDFRMSNHFVATSRHSPFSHRLFVQRILPGTLHILDELKWTTTHSGGELPPLTRDLEPAEVPKVLAETFGIQQSEEEAELLVARLAANAEASRASV